MAQIPGSTKFQCSEAVTAQKANCKDCGDRVRHNAKSWAERHVQLTGHSVEVSISYVVSDIGWPETSNARRAPHLDDVQCGAGI